MVVIEYISVCPEQSAKFGQISSISRISMGCDIGAIA
jgi:hypothetical protein